MLPSHVFIGPTKSGTSWIDSYLRTRNDVTLPIGLKETVFFDKRFERGLEWYESFFPKQSAPLPCIEVAPTLFGKPIAAERMKNILPDATAICTLRDPLDRAVSHYFHYLKCGETDAGFERMVAKYPDIITTGKYYSHAVSWISIFGPARVKFLLYDDMKKDLPQFCDTISDMLGIPTQPPPQSLLHEVANEAGVPRSRYLARAARNIIDTLRGAGAGRLVKSLDFAPVKQLIFGASPNTTRKDEIRAQAEVYSDILYEQVAELEKLSGMNLSRWHRRYEALRKL